MTGSSSSVPPHGGALFSAFNRLLSSMNAIGSLWILALMVLINFDSFGRTLFARPINGVIEIIELSLVGIIFMQLGDTTRRGGLTRSDGFFGYVLRHKPQVGVYLGGAFDLAGAVFMRLILYGSVPLLTEAYRDGYYVGEEGIFTFPVWPVKLIIALGCLVTLLQFAAFAWRYLWLRENVHSQIRSGAE